MTPHQIVARRMRNTMLLGPRPKDWTEIVRRFGAMQAQDFGPAKWSLGKRMPGLTNAEMDRAFNEGKILRTHALRPTWHFVLPEDIRWILELAAPRVHQKSSTAYKELELTPELGRKSNRLIARTLKGGNHSTRKELGDVLKKGGIETDSRRLGYLMSYAELEAVVCSGPLSGKQHTYALLEERAPDARRLDPDEALCELTLRYFSSHGPATVKDFAWWSSLKISEIKRGLDMAKAALSSEVVDTKTYWFKKGGRDVAIGSPRVHLLQAYDEYLVAYSETKGLLNLSGRARRLTDRTLFLGVITLDGQIAGHWRRRMARHRVHFDIALYSLLRGDRAAALNAAVENFGKFLGLPAQTSVTRLEGPAD